MGFFSKVAKSFVSGCLILAETADETYAIFNLGKFLEGKADNDDEIGIGTWLSMGIVAVAAVPTVLTMFYCFTNFCERRSE